LIVNEAVRVMRASSGSVVLINSHDELSRDPSRAGIATQCGRIETARGRGDYGLGRARLASRRGLAMVARDPALYHVATGRPAPNWRCRWK